MVIMSKKCSTASRRTMKGAISNMTLPLSRKKYEVVCGHFLGKVRFIRVADKIKTVFLQCQFKT